MTLSLIMQVRIATPNRLSLNSDNTNQPTNQVDIHTYTANNLSLLLIISALLLYAFYLYPLHSTSSLPFFGFLPTNYPQHTQLEHQHQEDP